MKNQSKQCLCEAKGVTFISSYAYCEKCGERIPSEKSKTIIETGDTIREIYESETVHRRSRASSGIY